MTLPAEGTLLTISVMGIPLYSARGLTQTYKPIEAAKQTERTLNGKMIDLSEANFQLLATTITCTDQRVPAFDGIWPGQRVTLHCVGLMSYPTGGYAVRPQVPGSVFTEGGFTFYRPILDVVFIDWNNSTAEWSADVQWSMDFEEQQPQ